MKKTVSLCIIAIMMVGLCLSGCTTGTAYIATVNGEKVPSGWYSSNVIYTAAQMVQNYGTSYYLNFLKQANATDFTRTNAQVLDDSAKRAFERNYTYKLMVESLGLTLDATGMEAFEAEYAFYKSAFFNTDVYNSYLKQSGLTEEEHRNIYMVSTYYPDMIYDYYFDEEVGIEKYDDATIRAFYDEYTDYCMQHILFAYDTTDENGNPLSSDQIEANKAEARKEAEDTVKKIENKEISFFNAMTTLSDDASLEQYPDGYAFKVGDGTLPDVFTTAAEELEVDQMGIYESDFGIHIMLKLDKDFYYETHKVIYEEAYTQDFIEKKVTEFKQNNVFIDYNDAALKKFSFENVGDPNIYLLSMTEDDYNYNNEN